MGNLWNQNYFWTVQLEVKHKGLEILISHLEIDIYFPLNILRNKNKGIECPKWPFLPVSPFLFPCKHSSALMSLNIFRWLTKVIDFGPSLMTLTHKLGIWNILLCIRKRNAAKIYYKVYRAWVPWEQSWIIFFGFLSRFWAKFYSLWNFIAKVTEIIFVWLMLWKDMVIRYSTVWTLKHSCLVIKNIICEKVFPL